MTVRRILSILAALFATLATALGGAAPATAATATMSGKLVNAWTNAAVPGCVNVADSNGEDVGFVCAGLDGKWSLANLISGATYSVKVDVSQDMLLDTQYTAVAPNWTATRLKVGSTLTGKLLGTTGSPLFDAQVSVRDSTGATSVAELWTSAEGEWSTIVPAGVTYTVRYTPPAPASIQWYKQATTAAAATRVAAIAGAYVTVNDQLLVSGPTGSATVQGRILDLAGAPIVGACAQLVTAYSVGAGDTVIGSDCTNDTGFYTFKTTTFATNLRVSFVDPSGAAVGEYWNDNRNPALAAAVTTAAGQITKLNPKLAPAGSITGRALAATTKAPIAGVCPQVIDTSLARTDAVLGAILTCSGTDGRWKVSGLGAGSYKIHLSMPAAFGGEFGYWVGGRLETAATALALTADQDLTVATVTYKGVGTVTGRITTATGAAVPDAWVDMTGAILGRSVGGAGYTGVSDHNGYYTITGVPAGTWKPAVSTGYSSWAPEWSGNATIPSKAVAITVNENQTTTWNADLVAASKLTGSVRNANGTTSTAYWIGDVYAGNSWMGMFDIYGNGTFTTSALPTGTFKIKLTNADTNQVFWYDATSDPALAKTVYLPAGSTKNLTIKLP